MGMITNLRQPLRCLQIIPLNSVPHDHDLVHVLDISGNGHAHEIEVNVVLVLATDATHGSVAVVGAAVAEVKEVVAVDGAEAGANVATAAVVAGEVGAEAGINDTENARAHHQKDLMSRTTVRMVRFM